MERGEENNKGVAETFKKLSKTIKSIKKFEENDEKRGEQNMRLKFFQST